MRLRVDIIKTYYYYYYVVVICSSSTFLCKLFNVLQLVLHHNERGIRIVSQNERHAQEPLTRGMRKSNFIFESRAQSQPKREACARAISFSRGVRKVSQNERHAQEP